MQKTVALQTYDLVPYRENGGSQCALMCPVCLDDNVHPVGVEVISPGQEHGKIVINSKGVGIDPTVPPSGRGVSICTRFQCEKGHSWQLHMQFHKGLTLVDIEAIKSAQHPETIWRE